MRPIDPCAHLVVESDWLEASSEGASSRTSRSSSTSHISSRGGRELRQKMRHRAEALRVAPLSRPSFFSTSNQPLNSNPCLSQASSSGRTRALGLWTTSSWTRSLSPSSSLCLCVCMCVCLCVCCTSEPSSSSLRQRRILDSRGARWIEVAFQCQQAVFMAALSS